MDARPVLLVLALLLAGCAGDPSSEKDGAAVTVIEVRPGVFLASDRGGIEGVVRNDAGLAVAGARASVIGEDAFADTDRNGHFLLLNVTAGTQRLFVLHESFQSADLEVGVAAGNITEVAVDLLPKSDRGAGYVPHVHDLWNGETEHTLIDRDIILAPSPSDSTTATAFANAQVRANSNQTWNIPLVGNAEERVIVRPGTATVTVTFSWDSTKITLPRLGLGYAHAAMPGGHVFLGPKTTGQSWTIPLTAPGMTDSGHQKFSLWSFVAYGGNTYTSPTTFQPAAINGPLHVKIVLTRGQVLLEPAHQNYWGNATTLELRSYGRATMDGGANIARTSANGLALDQGRIVPPGTGKLRIEFRVEYTAQSGTNVYDWDLTWRTGSQNPHTTGVKQYTWAKPIVNETAHKVWEIPLKDTDTDAFYQGKSNWVFVPWPHPWTDDAMYLEPRGRNFYLGVTATLDPAYSGE